MRDPFRGAVGKRVAEHLYAHVAALTSWPESLRALLERALSLAHVEAGEHFNVVKVHASADQLSLLTYNDFDEAPFPTLSKSWRINVQTEGVVYRDYTQSRNPPILHRKELLLPPTDPRIPRWAALTCTAEALGLFDDTSRIGFREQWLEQIAAKGYALDGHEFIPLANVPELRDDDATLVDGPVKRHLTALSRSNLSAPVQALWRHELIGSERSFFDYGCGRGDDLRALTENGIEATGWDPHFRPDAQRRIADTVNLGFVINVIEDLDERMEALRGAYALTAGVLAVAAMLASHRPPDGRPHRDGYLTSRNTFQKYFSQVQLRDFIEHVLDDAAVAVGPGVFFVFKDKLLEQRFLRQRYGGRSYGSRAWLAPIRTPSPPKAPRPRPASPSQAEALVSSHHDLLHDLWRTQIRLGRQPRADELTPASLERLAQAPFSLSRAFGLVEKSFDQTEVGRAEREKVDDLIVFAAMGQFGKRQPYRELDQALQRDVRHHFGDYGNWQSRARAMLHELTDPEKLNTACITASRHGLGWLEDSHSLQLHTDLVPRLPALLRIYIGCATVLVGELSEFDLVKVHIRSGKLSLLKYADFTNSPVPRLVQRIKVRLRELDLDVFDYGNEDHSSPLLFWKSRFINEECVHYDEQLAFEEQLSHAGLREFIDSEPSAARFNAALASHRWQIDGFALARSTTMPELDAACGRNFTYGDFVECGETQASTGLPNRPRQPDTYTALRDLAYFVLDPVIDYFGMIELTYGFCSPELARAIPGRIAPKLDQHAAHELTRTGRPICERLGAACDFLVTDEDMEEVALWVAAHTPFDRLYFYGKDRPIHVSYSATPARQFVRMTMNASGARVPRVDRTVSVFGKVSGVKNA